MAIPQIPAVSRDQAITDILEAMALQEAALASLIHAEAAKVDALVGAGVPAAASVEEVNSFQAAVTGVLQLAMEKQHATVHKLELIRSLMADKPNP